MKSGKAITLIELMMVIAIIGILAALPLPALSLYCRGAKRSQQLRRWLNKPGRVEAPFAMALVLGRGVETGEELAFGGALL